jgi:hypothetical protein
MSEIEQIPPVLTVIEDGGEYVIQASGPTGKRLGAIILSQLPHASRVTYMDPTGVKVFKSNGKVDPPRPHAPVVAPSQEAVSPVSVPPSRRIIQDGSAPPALELVEEDYEAQLRADEAEAAEMARQEQFNHQNALPPAEDEPEPESPRKRVRNINMPVNTCGRCAGAGSIMGESGMTGVCPVCKGKKVISTWGRQRVKPQAR